MKYVHSASEFFRPYGEPMEPGYDFAFPAMCDDADWRKRYAQSQLQWLQRWMPRPEAIH